MIFANYLLDETENPLRVERGVPIV